ncbi:MAG: metal ABC transporter substrate-binding protein [Nocardioidaceae bacterium]
MSRWRVPRVATVAAAVALVASSCATLPESARDTGRVRVAAAFYPLAWAAQQVGGPDVLVTNLTSPGGEPHDLELTVNETLAVARADLVVYERGFQPAVDDVIGNVAEGTLLDAADVVDLRDAVAPDTGADPHFWLDPSRMAELTDAIAADLGRADPRHRATYDANAAAVRARLSALDADFASGLASCQRDTIVVSHDAFGYLARYGLTIEAISGLSPGAEPSPADLARLQELVHDEGITTVFSERLASPRLAETLASDTGVRTEVLDPVEGLADATADRDYLDLMRANLRSLKEANGC